MSDHAYLKKHPRAARTAGTEQCGKGVPQPGWSACAEPGVWELVHLSGARYVATYCTEHAARRLRYSDVLPTFVSGWSRS